MIFCEVCTLFLLVFCGDDSTPGPHPLVCLTEFWLEAGCSETGQRVPANSDDTQLAFWNSYNVGAVNVDMAYYYSYAVNRQWPEDYT